MTETAQTPDVTMPIEFPLPDGTTRPMRVRIPTPEQLGVWQLNAERFNQLGAQWAQQESAMADRPQDDPERLALQASRNKQAARGLARAIKVVNSVLNDEDDRDWLEDQLMGGRLDMPGAMNVLTLTVEQLRLRNQQAAPTTGPQSKAKRAR